MDADGLPLVGTGIDFTKVGAIHQKRTLAFLNHFISHTSRFLNQFSCVCEEKLEQLTVKLQRLETTMNILDAKLSSIPGLEDVTVPSSSTTAAVAAPTSTPEAQTTPAVPAAPAPPATPSQPPVTEVTIEEAPAPEPAAAPVMTVSKDPRFAPFFKLLQIGANPMQIKQKMEASGFDPDLLDTPDAPAPSGAPPPPAPPAANESDSSDFASEKSEDSSDNDSDHDFSD